mmetsp:Transcript_35189/g.91302  ORF Transcript_35189/g.91302 Transcript_35189/m.91302 type:complete len:222 (-) Transcript_35189:8-673(-)
MLLNLSKVETRLRAGNSLLPTHYRICSHQSQCFRRDIPHSAHNQDMLRIQTQSTHFDSLCNWAAKNLADKHKYLLQPNHHRTYGSWGNEGRASMTNQNIHPSSFDTKVLPIRPHIDKFHFLLSRLGIYHSCHTPGSLHKKDRKILQNMNHILFLSTRADKNMIHCLTLFRDRSRCCSCGKECNLPQRSPVRIFHKQDPAIRRHKRTGRFRSRSRYKLRAYM